MKCPHCGRSLEDQTTFCGFCGKRINSGNETILVSSDPGVSHASTGSSPHPDSFGRYRVLREVGRGAMGVVYLARDDKIGRNVAIKSLHIDDRLPSSDKEEIRERLEREARAAGVLSHANIVTVYDVGEEDGVPYIAMEYLEGATLTEITADGPLSIPQATSIIEQVLSALSYAHGHDVVHRDIKPDNVFLLPDGRVKVADFGIARLASSSTMTQVGQVMGTPGYMSPEQVKGEPVGPSSDIFSTGVLFYELLTGTAAFASTSATSIMYKIVHEEPRALHLINPGVPSNLEAVIAKATAKSPTMRYASAAEMRADLESGTSPAMPAQQVSHDGTVLRAAAMSQDMPGSAYTPAPAAAAPTPKKKTAVIVGVASGAVVLAAVIVVALVFLLGGSKVSLTITNPNEKSVTNPVTVRVDVKNPARVARLEISVDNHVQKVIESAPYEAQVETGAGAHTILVTAYAKDNATLAEANVDVEAAVAEVPQAQVQTTASGSGGGEGRAEEPEETTMNYFAGGAKGTYHNAENAYTINYPAGWTRTEEKRDYGYRVKWWSPDRQMYFLIDASPLAPNETDASVTPKQLNQSYSSKSGYQLYQITPQGQSACIWEFALTSSEDDFFKGKTVRKYDYFINGSRFGYAILLAGRPQNYSINLQPFLQDIVQNFQPDT
jgi:serine/threonine protein kinase